MNLIKFLQERYSRFKEITKKHGLKRSFHLTLKHFKDDIIGNMKYKISRLFFRLKYGDSYADPFKVIWIDPSKIKKRASGSNRYCGAIEGEDWDLNTSPLGTHFKIRALYKRFKDGYSWEETGIIKNRKLNLQNRGIVDGLFSKEEILDYYKNEVEKLYQEIKEKGYKSQLELGNADNSKPGIEEVGVAIARNGEILKCGDGAHRLAIAKILDVEEMPVKVTIRHKKWQELRKEIVETERFEDLSERAKKKIGHPDLQDIVLEEWREKGNNLK